MPTVNPPFTDLLVPLDGSPAAERAIPPAVELARRTGVPLRLMRQAYSDDIDDAVVYLATAARRHAAGVDVETQVMDRESVPNAILDARHPGTLVCMSSHCCGRRTDPCSSSAPTSATTPPSPVTSRRASTGPDPRN
jgi:nucleotide-binding universal stress UspA family protein